MSTHVAETIVERYKSRTPGSMRCAERAKRSLPGGDSRSVTFYSPYPAYMVRGEGCHLVDCDGNRYIDFLNNYTSLIHGHAHPAIVQAASAQLEKGAVLGSASEAQAELAGILCERVPGIDVVRFCNSGTEATMMAMRAARAYTGRDLIIKMDGGYHGSHDFAEVNVIPRGCVKGFPEVRLEGRGIPTVVLDGVLISRFNDAESVARLLAEYAGQVAAIILEPMMGAAGMIPPGKGYLRALRSLADEHNVLLIFDEVITFRLGLGGLQAREAVSPDLTALGKIIGGGFAVGAFGGRREIMALFDPYHPESLIHSGTFNGNNITMAAGAAAMRYYDQAAVDQINELGDRLRTGFCHAFRAAGIKGGAKGIGSLMNLYWGERGPLPMARSERDVANAEMSRLLHLEMLNRGIFAAVRGMFCVSTAMTGQEIDGALQAMDGALQLLRPHVAKVAPHLLSD